MIDATNTSISAYNVMKNAANTNRMPKNKLIRRMVFISLCVAPLVTWIVW
jgi:hypothetical protein